MSDDQHSHAPPLPWEHPVSPDPAELEVLASVSRRLDRTRRWLEALDTAPSPAPPAGDAITR